MNSKLIKVFVVASMLLGIVAPKEVKKFDIDDLSEYPDLAPYILAVHGGYKQLSEMMSPVTDVAKKIPWRHKRTPPKDPISGEPLYHQIPEDLYRRYDEATISVHERRYKAGKKIVSIPLREGREEGLLKEVVNGQTDCYDTVEFGYLLGFAYGLQYNYKVKGTCYLGIETVLAASEDLLDALPSLLNPTESAKVMLQI